MAHCLSNIDVEGVLQQVINFQRIRQGAPRCLTLSSYTVAANGAPRAKRDVYMIALFSSAV